jgi:hypothetical protein
MGTLPRVFLLIITITTIIYKSNVNDYYYHFF